MKNFCLQIWRMRYQKISLFHTDLRNVRLILVKSAPKKSFSKKTVLPIEKVPEKSFFWAKIFCVCTFYKGQMYIFDISMNRRIFWYPIRPIQRKKSFHLTEESMCTFDKLKVQNATTTQYFVNLFLRTGLSFSPPFQNFMPDIVR